jgi:hypothetical protein
VVIASTEATITGLVETAIARRTWSVGLV